MTLKKQIDWDQISFNELNFTSQAEERGSDARVSVFMEHFSLEHQVLLKGASDSKSEL